MRTSSRRLVHSHLLPWFLPPSIDAFMATLALLVQFSTLHEFSRGQDLRELRQEETMHCLPLLPSTAHQASPRLVSLQCPYHPSPNPPEMLLRPFHKDQTARLVEACRVNDVASLAAMLAEDPSLVSYESQPKERNLLLLATRAGSLDVVHWLLLNHGASLPLSVIPSSSSSSFSSSSSSLPRHINIDSQDREGKSALNLACGFVGCPRLVSLLLAFGADATQADGRGLTPLLTAAWQGQRAAVEALLDWHRKKKEEMEERGGGGERSGIRLRQQWLSSFSYSTQREKHLVETHGQKRGREGASSPSLPSPSLLLSQIDARGRSALYLSAAYGHNAVVSLLLAMGADPRARSKDGKTARDKAEARGEKEVVGLLKQFEEEPGRIRVLFGMRVRKENRQEIAVDVGVEKALVKNQLQLHQEEEEELGREEEKEKETNIQEEKRDGGGRIVCRGKKQRGWWRGWRQVTGVEGGVQDGKEDDDDDDDEDGETNDKEREEEEEDEEEGGNVYGAIPRPWSWRVWRRRMVKVGGEEGWRGEGQGESAEQRWESRWVGEINEASKKYEKEGQEDNQKGMEKVGKVAHLVVTTLPDDLFVELAGFMRLPWDEDEEDERIMIKDRKSK